MKPDFLIIPHAVQQCRKLRPSDWIVYAVIYWYEHLRDGECRASNDSIGDIAGIAERTVRDALNRLEANGFIKRHYRDAEQTIREKIESLVAFRAYQTKLPLGKELVKAEKKGPTPGETARDFFAAPGATSEGRERIIDEIVAATGGNKEAIMREARKFYAYWTEPNKSGTKQLWELKQTFDVKRRLYTWLSKSGQFKQGGGSKRSGSGTVL